MTKDGMHFPRMSTWVRKYGPFIEVQRADLAKFKADRILSICTSDEGNLSFGDPGIRYVNVEKYLVAAKPIPQNTAECEINVLGIRQAGF